MIPSIEEIVAGLLNGSIPKERAIAWLEKHLELAYESGCDR